MRAGKNAAMFADDLSLGTDNYAFVIDTYADGTIGEGYVSLSKSHLNVMPPRKTPFGSPLFLRSTEQQRPEMGPSPFWTSRR